MTEYNITIVEIENGFLAIDRQNRRFFGYSSQAALEMAEIARRDDERRAKERLAAQMAAHANAGARAS